MTTREATAAAGALRPNFEIVAPDNPMIIFLDAISYIAKRGDGCVIRTVDGMDHVFLSVTYPEMIAQFREAR